MYHEILGVKKDATKGEIRKAYLNLASKYHPDKFSNPRDKEIAHKKFIEISNAYDILMNNNVGSHHSYNSVDIFTYFENIFKEHLKMFHRHDPFVVDFDRLMKSDIGENNVYSQRRTQNVTYINGKKNVEIKELITENGVTTEKITKIDSNGVKTKTVRQIGGKNDIKQIDMNDNNKQILF